MDWVQKGGENRGNIRNTKLYSSLSGRPGLGIGQIAITAGPVMRQRMKGETEHGYGNKEIKETTFENTKLNVVQLDWKEVYYTNCPLVSASNVDEGLGLTKKEYKKIGVKYAYMRSTPENDWYPHYIHNLDNLIRFGGLFPPIEVHADIRRTRLLGVTQMPAEGGVMMVRAKDDIYRMADLKGKKIGISKSMNKIKNDWWRIQEHQGIELMLRMNGMTMDDIQLVEFPYADDWYNDPAMMDRNHGPLD